MRVRRSRATGLFALGTFILALILPLVAAHHGLGDDNDSNWGEPRFGLGHPVTQFETVDRSTPDDHCALCHWARSFRTTIAGKIVQLLQPTGPTALVTSEADSDLSTVCPARRPRGPPATI